MPAIHATLHPTMTKPSASLLYTLKADERDTGDCILVSERRPNMLALGR